MERVIFTSRCGSHTIIVRHANGHKPVAAIESPAMLGCMYTSEPASLRHFGEVLDRAAAAMEIMETGGSYEG